MARKRPGDGTGIEWTHLDGFKGETWNPTVGCSRVSPGCDHCYAFSLHDQRYKNNLDAAREAMVGSVVPQVEIKQARHAGVKLPWPLQYDKPFSQVQLLDDTRLNKPARERAPRAYFVDSMADLFHEDVPDEFLDRVHDVMEKNSRHRFLILTKRAARQRAYVNARYRRVDDFDGLQPGTSRAPGHIAYGVSAEDQPHWDDRVVELMQTNASVRFVSVEPMLGPIVCARIVPTPYAAYYPLEGIVEMVDGHGNSEITATGRIHQIIVGGESGPHWRPMELDWARAIRDECAKVGTAFFFKQRSAARNGQPAEDTGLDECKAFPPGLLMQAVDVAQRRAVTLRNRTGEDEMIHREVDRIVRRAE